MTFLLTDEQLERERVRPTFQIPAGCESLLIGEGRNDARFLTALARSSYVGNTGAWGYWTGGGGGIEALGEDLKSAINTGAFLRLRSFALVLDADRDGDAALKNIDNCMKACFQTGANFAHGEVRKIAVRGEEIRVGAFVMPGGANADGNIKGKLEDLVLRAAAQTHQKEMECVRQFRKCVWDIGNQPKKEQDEEKKKAQAYLSALPENKVYLGVAAEDKVIDFSAPAFDELKGFLKKLSP